MEGKPNRRKEENPFEDSTVAQEWITSVENEEGFVRDRDIYPKLAQFIKETRPKRIVEVGAGQGVCSDHLESEAEYIGIEPSKPLVERANELYGKHENRHFVVGDAYGLPLESASTDAIFSVNVLFHLENLDSALQEMSRVLKEGGRFLVITVNEDAYEKWASTYEDVEEEGKLLVGKNNIPVLQISRNTFYRHTMEETRDAFARAGLVITHEEALGEVEGTKLFVSIEGKKG